MDTETTDNPNVDALPTDEEIWRSLEKLSDFLEHPDPRNVAEAGLKLLGPLVGAEQASIYLSDPELGLVLSGEVGGRALPPRIDFGDGQSPSLMLRAARDLEPLFIEDVEEFRRQEGLDIPRRPGCARGPSCIVIPIVSQGKVWGVLNFAALRRPLPDPHSAAAQALLHGSRLLAMSLGTHHLLKHLEAKATHDSLTQLYNYGAFYDLLEKEIARVRRYGEALCLILVDIDSFKQINDEYGHLAGDVVLSGLANRIRSILRSSDLPARYGGDEFAIILPQTPLEGARCLARRIQDAATDASFEYVGTEIRSSVSCGVAEYDSGHMTPRKLVESADSDLYLEKRKRKKSATPG